MKDDFGDRMKLYEQIEAGRRAMPLLPICARIDGRSFSKWTHGLARPFDTRLSALMVEVVKFLVAESKALIGYTQSDEISLVFGQTERGAERVRDGFSSEVFFDGKFQKLTSVLASLATAKFNSLVPSTIPEKKDRLAAFDCRVWTVPNMTEAANVLLWREKDATKNSVSMAARAHYSHSQLDGKSCSEMQEMLFQKGVNWNDYPAFFKRGTFVRRRNVKRSLSPEEIARIPEKHRPAPDATFERSELHEMDMPPFVKVVNRVEVIFDGAEPKTAEPEPASA